MDFPLGFRFSPTEEQKIHLLLHKVTGVYVTSHDFIRTCDLYGDKEPWEIFGDSDESELYFFTVLKKVGNKKNASDYKRFSRNIGKGSWSNKGKTLPIYRKRGPGVIGYKKSLRYEPKKKEGGDDHHNGTWLMKEYSLPENLHGMKEEYKNCVLCVLKRKGSPCRDVESHPPTDIASTMPWNNTEDDELMHELLSNFNVSPLSNTAISDIESRGSGHVFNSMDAMMMMTKGNTTTGGGDESRRLDLDHLSNGIYDPSKITMDPITNTTTSGSDHVDASWDDTAYEELMSMMNAEVTEIHCVDSNRCVKSCRGTQTYLD